MDDLYDKVKGNVALRKKLGKKCGIGFELSSVPNQIPQATEIARFELFLGDCC